MKDGGKTEGAHYYYEVHNYSFAEGNVCNSSMLSRQAVGDIVSAEKKADFSCPSAKIRKLPGDLIAGFYTTSSMTNARKHHRMSMLIEDGKRRMEHG